MGITIFCNVFTCCRSICSLSVNFWEPTCMNFISTIVNLVVRSTSQCLVFRYLPCPSLFLFCCSKSFPPPPTMCAWSWLPVWETSAMGVIEIWVSVSFENSYSSCHPFEWGFRVYAESPNIGYNWPGLVVICHGNFLLSLLMCGLFDWTKLTPNLPDVLLAPVNNKTMPGSSGVHSWSWAHTLRSQAREHSGEELQSMWNQSDWSGQQLFPDRPSLLLCAVTLLPCTRSHSWSSIQPEDWYVVSWLHPRRALLRKCEFIASLISCTVLCLLVSNYLLVLSMYWRYLCRRYIILSWLFCLLCVVSSRYCSKMILSQHCWHELWGFWGLLTQHF